MRLIDADELRKQMYHQAFETDTDMQRWDSGCWIRYKMFENAIESAPTVDPVKHGRWIFSPSHAEGICSRCNFKIYGKPYNNTYLLVPYNYCPNCGALMDEEE